MGNLVSGGLFLLLVLDCLLSCTKFLSLVSSSVEIAVDIEWPENNRELTIYSVPFFATEVVGVTVPGYAIVYPMDIQYIKKNQQVEHYKGRVFSDSQVLLTVPAWNYSELYGEVEWADSECNENVKAGMQNARHDHRESKDSRQWKSFMFYFPSGHKLSSKEIYKDAGEDQELDVDFVKVLTSRGKEKKKQFSD